MDGLVLIDKKIGVTSYDVVKLVKRHFNTSKVGHCGTLDPFASGLLIIGFNQATKVMSFLEHDYKEYEAVIKLGSSTDSYDITGNVISSSDIKEFSEEQLENVISSFVGEITQTPPIYSAIHVDGKHLYEYARENIEVEIPKRNVTIFDLKVLSYDKETIRIYVKCSRGTYIRTLGVDIANKLNNDGHLIELRRLSIGNLSVNDAISYDDLKEENVKVITINDALSFKKLYISDPKILRRVYNGQDIYLKNEDEDKIVIVDNDNATAIYEKIDEHKFHCIRGLFNEDTRFKRLKEFYE